MNGFANLTCVLPAWDVSTRVTAFTTTRLGGVSKEPFNELNLGFHVGDDREAVIENRRRLVESLVLPDQPVWLKQTHGTVVASIASTTDSDGELPIEADGAYTCTADTVLAVLTADCLPVVISDVQGSQLAVVHAGWRGLADGIVHNALKRFRQGSELHAWLGPAIGPSRFEVGDDVRDAFIAQRPENVEHFMPGRATGKYWGDLYALARSALTADACTTVSGGDYCTYSQSDRFYSYRRDGAESGRMATVAWLSRE